MRRIEQLARGFVAALAWLGVIAYGAAALATVADILGRRIGMPIEGVVDLVQLFVMAGAWLVMPWAFMTGAHVGVDALVDKLPRAARAALRIFAGAVAAAFVALMLWQGWETYLLRTMFGDTSQQLGIPIAWYWWPLLLGLLVSPVAVILGLIASPDIRRNAA